MFRSKFKILSRFCPMYWLMLLLAQNAFLIDCNPIAFNPNFMPMIAVPQGFIQGSLQSPPNAMMMANQFNPYTPAYASLWAPFDVASRRSLPNIFGGFVGNGLPRGGPEKTNNEEPSDEQKALDGLPLSLVSVFLLTSFTVCCLKLHD